MNRHRQSPNLTTESSSTRQRAPRTTRFQRTFTALHEGVTASPGLSTSSGASLVMRRTVFPAQTPCFPRRNVPRASTLKTLNQAPRFFSKTFKTRACEPNKYYENYEYFLRSFGRAIEANPYIRPEYSSFSQPGVRLRRSGRRPPSSLRLNPTVELQTLMYHVTFQLCSFPTFNVSEFMSCSSPLLSAFRLRSLRQCLVSGPW